MANINQISLKVCGNPDANGGFQPMVIFNSPSIEIKDTVYAGFDANSYFFTIKIENNQVVYKLIKNNVSSLGASRQGSLVIGIAIPKGYKLDVASPYDVLMELKKAFITRCMTCKDPATEKYEFNTNRVQPNILDDIAGSYVLVPVQMPYRPMAVGAPIAYLTATEEKIAQLMKDVQYPTFAKYSEIVIAETVQSPNYAPISNLPIPRLPEYTIYDNGVKMDKIIQGTNTPIIIEGNGDPLCYDNEKLSFTIEDLLVGNIVPNVKFDAVTESIHINSKALEKPRTQKVQVSFIPQDSETYFYTYRNEWVLYYGTSKINLSNDFRFSLKGEQIKILSNPQGFRVEQTRKDEYVVRRISATTNEVKIEAEKIRTTPRRGLGISTGGSYPSVQSSIVNACEVQFITKRSSNSGYCNMQFINSNDVVLQNTKADYQDAKNGLRVAKAYVPKSWVGSDKRVRIKFPKENWESIYSLDRDNNGVIELCDNDFKHKSIGFFIKHSRRIVICILMLLSLLLGVAIGAYIGSTYFGSSKATETFNCEKCGGIFATETELSSHMCDEQPIQSQPSSVQGNSVTCPDCEEGPFDESEYETHKNTCPKKLKCDKCSERFASESDLNDHKANAHSTQNNQFHHCENCGRDFTSSAGLKAHKDELHSIKECKLCHETFENQKALTEHMNKSHHFVCAECGSSTYFLTQAELDTHKRGKRKDGKNHSR